MGGIPKSPSQLLGHGLPPFCHSVELCGSVPIFSLSENVRRYLFVLITEYNWVLYF